MISATDALATAGMHVECKVFSLALDYQAHRAVVQQWRLGRPIRVLVSMHRLPAIVPGQVATCSQ